MTSFFIRSLLFPAAPRFATNLSSVRCSIVVLAFDSFWSDTGRFSCHEELKKYSKSLKFFLSKTVHYYCELWRRNSFWSDETSMITMHVRCHRKVTSRRIELENASSEKSQLQEPSNQKIRYASHGYRYTSRPIRMSVTPVHVAVDRRPPEGPAQRVAVLLLLNLSTVM